MSITIDITAFTDSISDRVFEQLCANNPETRFETNAKGELIVMSPTGSESGRRNGDLIIQIGVWNRQAGKPGVVFDSSTGFKLSNGATRSPDVSWIELSRWNSLSTDLKRGFAPIDPDFVIELMSPTDNLLELQQKMKEYMDCRIKLGWLINPDEKQIEIYSQGQDKEVLNNPIDISGEDVLSGFVLDLTEIFE